MTNAEIAGALEQVSLLLQARGENVFKVRAWDRAAQTAAAHPEELAAVVRASGEKGLRAIPGIGESIAKAIIELVTTGRSSDMVALQKSLPAGLLTVMSVPGVGPKTAIAICETLGVSDLDGLEKACREGKIRALPRQSEKTEAKILAGVALRRQGMERRPLWRALELSEALLAFLSKRKEVQRSSEAGSLRRRCETVGDLDLLVVSVDPEATVAAFTGMSRVQRVLGAGTTKASVLLAPTEPGEPPLQCDLRLVPSKSFGAALHYFTGSKDHNVRLRELAQTKKMKLNEYGLFRLHGAAAGAKSKHEEKELLREEDWKHWVAGEAEEDVFRALGLPWIAPELREDAGELDAALAHRLPTLLEMSDLKGDLHAHTDWSDGRDSIEAMAEAARAAGHEYLAISDHSFGERQANGLSPERVAKQLAILKKLNAEYARTRARFRLLAASECDIRPDGSMDFDDALLAKLDVVVASVHSGWTMSEQAQTARIERALRNPYVTVLGHPTGRLIGQRAPYPVDMARVLHAAAESGTFVEMDSHPARLDLKDAHARAAKNAGCLLSVDSDAHGTTQLGYLRFGVWTARRGWIEASDVANTRPLDRLLALVNEKRSRLGGTPSPASLE